MPGARRIVNVNPVDSVTIAITSFGCSITLFTCVGKEVLQIRSRSAHQYGTMANQPGARSESHGSAIKSE